MGNTHGFIPAPPTDIVDDTGGTGTKRGRVAAHNISGERTTGGTSVQRHRCR